MRKFLLVALFSCTVLWQAGGSVAFASSDHPSQRSTVDPMGRCQSLTKSAFLVLCVLSIGYYNALSEIKEILAGYPPVRNLNFSNFSKGTTKQHPHFSNFSQGTKKQPLPAPKSILSNCTNLNSSQCLAQDYCRFDATGRECEMYPGLGNLDEDDDIDEGRCFDRSKIESKPLLSTSDPLQVFKYHSSWMFKSWIDWTGKCALQDVNDTNYRAAHEEKDLYHIRNFCLSTKGGLSGYEPSFDRYEGCDETSDIYRDRVAFADNFIDLVEPLEEEPECFLDTKVIFMPLPPVGQENVGHTQHRILSLLRIMSLAYPGVPKKDILIIWVQSQMRDQLYPNAAAFYYQLLGTSWASVTNPRFVNDSFFDQAFGMRPYVHDGLDQKVCFKHAVVWQNCRQCKPPDEKAEYGFGLWSYSRYHFQMVNDLKSLYVSCFNLSMHQQTRKAHPVIAWDYRTESRMIRNLREMSHDLERTNKSRIFFRQMYSQASSFRKYAQMVYNSDIMIGVHGAALTQSILLPPGGVLIELLPPAWSWSLRDNPHLTMYGVYTYPSNVHHEIYIPPPQNVGEKNGELILPIQVLNRIVDISLCLHARERECPDLEATLDYLLNYSRVSPAPLLNYSRISPSVSVPPASWLVVGASIGGFAMLGGIVYKYYSRGGRVGGVPAGCCSRYL